MLRRLINEILLHERIFGAQAFVYHGSRAEPDIFIPFFERNEFNPGKGDGAMYGKGLYTVHDLKGTRTGAGEYGNYIYKFRVNLYGYISFDDDVTTLIYGKRMSQSEQAKLVSADSRVVSALKITDNPDPINTYTSNRALEASKRIRGLVKGLIYTGSRDGRVALVYDDSTATLVAWKKVTDESWTPVDKEKIRQSIAANVHGAFKKEKYEQAPQEDDIVRLRKVGRLPPQDRVLEGPIDVSDKDLRAMPNNVTVKGSLNLAHNPIEQLPENLTVRGDLNIRRTNITVLPSSLVVEGELSLNGTNVEVLSPGLHVGILTVSSNSNVTEIPEDISIRHTLNLQYSRVSSFPESLKTGLSVLNITDTRIQTLPDGLNVMRDLSVSETDILQLPEDLFVGRHLVAVRTKITSLPKNFRIGGDLVLTASAIKELPDNLVIQGDLDIRNTTMTKLPAGLDVRGNLFMHNTQIRELPDDLKVRGEVSGFKPYDLRL